ncbi:hypothetical protein FRX31_027481, partial [Thalictrum thalictroides]
MTLITFLKETIVRGVVEEIRRSSCSSKEEGGLGIRRIKVMNQALFLKGLWRYGTERDTLWKKVIEAKYGPCDIGGRPSKVTQSHGCSLWRSIQCYRDVFFK